MRDTSPLTPVEARRYYKNLQKVFDQCCAELGVPFRICLAYYVRLTNKQWQVQKSILNALAGDGHIYKETTAPSAINAAKHIISGDNIGLWGLPQMGKTDVQVLASIIASIYFNLKDGAPCIPIFFTPNVSNVIGQFETKMYSIIRAFDEAVIKVGKEEMRVHDWHVNSIDLISNEFSEELRKFMALNKSAAIRVDRQYPKLARANGPIVLPMAKGWQDFFRLLATSVHKTSGRLIIGRDESHFAVAQHSINDRMFSQQVMDDDDDDSGDETPVTNKDDLDDGTIYSMIQDAKVPVSVVMCSATNWCCGNLQPVRIKTTKDYVGINIRYEFPPDSDEWHQVADEDEYTPMQVCSMSEFGNDLLDEPNFAAINGRWYSQASEFRKAISRGTAKFPPHIKDYRQYKGWCAHTVFKTISTLLFTDNFKGHRGMLVRFVCNNGVTAELIDDMRPRLDKIGVKPIFAFDTEFNNIEELIWRETNGDDEQKYVVFVTARGRMSDSFPPDCGYGLDCTWRSTYFATILQGVLGRMMGYFKDPFVVMSDHNTARIRESIAKGGIPVGKVCGSYSVSKRARYFTYHIEDHGGDKVFISMVQKIDKLLKVSGQKPIYRKGGTYAVILGSACPVDVWGEVIEPNLEYLGKHLMTHQSLAYNEGDRFLLPGEFDDREVGGVGRHYAEENGFVKLSWRTDHSQKRGARPGRLGQAQPLIIRGKITANGESFEVTGFDLFNWLPKNDGVGYLNESSVPSKVGKKKDNKVRGGPHREMGR